MPDVHALKKYTAAGLFIEPSWLLGLSNWANNSGKLPQKKRAVSGKRRWYKCCQSAAYTEASNPKRQTSVIKWVESVRQQSRLQVIGHPLGLRWYAFTKASFSLGQPIIRNNGHEPLVQWNTQGIHEAQLLRGHRTTYFDISRIASLASPSVTPVL
jgi:hypothetical protein